jgi:hypothetical protein
MASGLHSSLRALADSGADFIVVGDIAAALHGAPLGGFDLTVVAREPAPAYAGMIRILSSVGRGRTYDDLLPESTILEMTPGLSLRVANLEAVITLKEEQGTLVDLAVLPTLRATLAEIRRLKSAPPTTSE